MTLVGETGSGGAVLLAARVEQLEKALQGYRDLLAVHDQDPNTNGRFVFKNYDKRHVSSVVLARISG